MLKQLSKETYSEALSKFKTVSFTQTIEMGSLLEKRGYDVFYMGFEIDDDIKVLALLYSISMFGGKSMEINFGPVHKGKEYYKLFLAELQKFAKRQGALQLTIKPYDTYQEFDSQGKEISEENKDLIRLFTDLGFQYDGLKTGYPGGEPYWNYVKDLSNLTPETLRKSYSKKGRPLANKTSSFGIKIRRLNRDELYIFKEITASTSERREYSDKSLEYYQHFYDSFAENCEFMVASIDFKEYLSNLKQDYSSIQMELSELNVKISEGINSAKVNKQKVQLDKQLETFKTRIQEAKEFLDKYGSEEVILAGSLFVYTPQESVYLFSGSYTEFNKFYAPVALQEHVMLESLKRGINFYNFLGIQGIFDGSDGVLRFKQNFNGYILRKTGIFRYYPNPLKYKFVRVIKKILGR